MALDDVLYNRNMGLDLGLRFVNCAKCTSRAEECESMKILVYMRENERSVLRFE